MKLVFARDQHGFSLAHVECDNLIEAEEFEMWLKARIETPQEVLPLEPTE